MKKFLKNFKKDWQLHLMILIPAIYMLIFHYGPIYGLQIAFRDYTVKGGIMGSEWVGLKWFEKFITSYKFKTVLVNTVVLSVYSMIASFPFAVVFALGLNAVKGEKLKKFTQTVSYIPHFVSVAVLVGIVNMLFSPVSGLYGNLYRMFGGAGYPKDFRASAGAFRHLYVWSGVWQELGWNSIIYVAALSSVPMELHEAAKIDGASRLKRIRYVDFPCILPTVAIMLIMNCGHLVSIGFEKAYMMQSGINQTVSEVIATYVYKAGMGSVKDFSYGAAVGLFNTVINLTLLLSVNFITKRMTSDNISLF